MGMKDTVTKDYLKQNVIFADVFNYALYDGEQRIDSQQLVDKDVSEISLPFGEDGEMIPIQKYRDLLKGYIAKEYQGNLLIILGVENQSEIHYAMPVKCMLYDALNYASQVDEKRKEYRERRKNKELDFKESSAEFGKTMNFISKSKDKEEMKQLLSNTGYKTFSKTAAKIIREFAGLKIEIDEGKEMVDVCKAWEEQKEDGIRIGEDRINRLIIKLADLGRSEDIVKAAKDTEYQKQLIEELGL